MGSKKKNRPFTFPDRFWVWAPLLLLALGFAVRLIGLGNNPPGLNQDEASAGYEAFALLTAGIDRAGNPWPVLFTAWGSGQNALYSYLSIPFVALLGLTEFSTRLVAALAGCAALPIAYFTAKRLGGRAAALAVLLCLSVNPWHIMISRWALESNLFPFLLLAGLALLAWSGEHSWCWPAAAAVFALSLYAYGTAFLFLPAFALICLPYLLAKRAIPLRPALLSLGVFIVIALPIALCNLRNLLELPSASFLWMTLPRLTVSRAAATTVLGGDALLSGMLSSFSGFLRLMLSQTDGLPFNSVPGFGTLYLFGLPLAVWGAALAARRVFGRGRPFSPEFYPLAALFASVLCSFFIQVNINRINMIYIPLIYFSGVGVLDLTRRLGRLAPLPAAAYLLSFALFCGTYGTQFRQTASPDFFEGFGPAIRYAETLNADREYITDQVQMPYIFVLFYNRIPPGEFLRTIQYLNPGADFQWAASFGKYVFGFFPEEAGAVYVVHVSELDRLPAGCILTRFGNYAVARAPG